MIRVLLILILSLFSLSCSVEQKKRDIYLITIADDFYGYNATDRKLENVVTDQAALFMEFQTLGSVEVMSFISEDGKRYLSRFPSYIPKDKDGNTLESPDHPDFRRYSYSPKAGEGETKWRARDVLDYIGSLETEKNDLVVVSYSGHGNEGNGNLMVNASPSSRDYEEISREELLERLSSIPGKKLLILDSCYSGLFIPSSSFHGADIFASGEKEDRWLGSNYPETMWRAAIEKKDQGESLENIWILASSGRSQESSDNLDAGDSRFQTCYGAFTYYILKGLGYDTERNIPGEGKKSISVFSLYAYVRSNFPDYETQIQTPRVSMKGLDLRIK